jgi:hypothetical protein
VSENLSSFRSALLRYGRLLDCRQYEVWLGLFSTNAVYQVIQREHHERGQQLFLINERLPALRARVSAYADTWESAFLHFFSDVSGCSEGKEELAAAQAPCLIFGRGELLHVASYSLTFNAKFGVDQGGFVDSVLIVLEAPSVRAAITVPI